jgi:hypothetical protein
MNILIILVMCIGISYIILGLILFTNYKFNIDNLLNSYLISDNKVAYFTLPLALSMALYIISQTVL